MGRAQTGQAALGDYPPANGEVAQHGTDIPVRAALLSYPLG